MSRVKGAAQSVLQPVLDVWAARRRRKVRASQLGRSRPDINNTQKVVLCGATLSCCNLSHAQSQHDKYCKQRPAAEQPPPLPNPT
ncbi:hypothetical protein HaLaN_00702, partial [Haematococcus lacustris]